MLQLQNSEQRKKDLWNIHLYYIKKTEVQNAKENNSIKSSYRKQ